MNDMRMGRINTARHNGVKRRGCKACALLVTLLLCLWGMGAARAMDQAKPGQLPPGHPPINAAADPGPAPGEMNGPQIAAQDRTAFERAINVDDLRLLSLLHRDQVKILDSWARQSLSAIMHRQKYQGQDPLYTALDMAFRPEAWQQLNIIYIRDMPIRQQLGMLAPGATDDARRGEQQRIVQTGLVSPVFLEQREVSDLLERTSAADVRLAPGISRVFEAVESFRGLQEGLLVAPPAMGTNDTWIHPYHLQGNIPELSAAATQRHEALPVVAGYSARQAAVLVRGFGELEVGWRTNNVGLANQGIALLAANAPALNEEVYRSGFTRGLELWYNRFFNGTLLAGTLYFVALTLFLIGAVGVTTALRRWALAFFSSALLVHMVAMAARWWLADRIPIQNQFESVLASALLGCMTGLVLELRKRNNLFGLAMSFVGAMAMLACFAVPYIWGKEIGESIGKVAGVLNDYWLYIHVNIVVDSYALIAASFVLGLLYLAIRLWHWINPLVEPEKAVQMVEAVAVIKGVGGNGAGATVLAANGAAVCAAAASARARLLEVIDGANVVILQMAFWALGTGIACGAIWADHSWGRFWGWDPKETFALVTWIVYMIIVHVRFVTPRNKALWTAVLSVVGFAVMLFNWIGVNFFLAGLHSYA